MVKRIILTSVISLLFLGAVVCYFSFAGRYCSSRKKTVICENIVVNYENSQSLRIIEEDEIIKELGDVIGSTLDTLDLNRLENNLLKRGEILSAQIYGNIKGCLTVDVIQRYPIARLQNDVEKYYITDNGYIMPIRCIVNDIPIITGYIPTAFGKKYQGYAVNPDDKEWIEKIAEMCNCIKNDKFLNEQIEQIYIEENSELTLYTRVTGPKIIFGQPDRIETKFIKLKAYYQSIAPVAKEKAYKEINLAFRNQIICK